MSAASRIEETVLPAALRLHQRIYIRSGGRVGHRLLGVPSLLLKTQGRRSGAERTNALIYERDGDDYIVVASNGGAPNHPAWFHNLSADPQVRIQVGTREMPASARVIEPANRDYDRLWRRVNASNRGRYDGYQAKTERPIRLVALTPR